MLLVILFICIAHTVQGQDSTYINSIGMEFVRIDTGRMVVGRFEPPYPVADDTVRGARRSMVMWMGDGRPYNTEEFSLARTMAMRDATTGFEVTIDRPYYIGRFEVTQEQWEQVMGDNPSMFQGKDIGDTRKHPVESVTWDEVQKFLQRLNAKEGATRYRLPTEFEWEYAARAGADGDIAWSVTEQVAQLGTKTTQPVGQKKPNEWGLYDMLGNVWEWVEDYYNEKIFADPEPQSRGAVHVLKGASFVGDVKNATWLTHAGGPGNGWDVGFRLVMEIEEE